jgi:hypothetical protein
MRTLIAIAVLFSADIAFADGPFPMQRTWLHKEEQKV